MNKEDKILALLEKMAGDFIELKGDVGALKQGQVNLETHIGTIEGRMDGMEAGQNILARQITILVEDVQEIRQSQVRMENELTEKVRALFDAREVQNDANERIITTLSRIENKLDNQLWEVNLRTVK